MTKQEAKASTFFLTVVCTSLLAIASTRFLLRAHSWDVTLTLFVVGVFVLVATVIHLALEGD